MKANLIFVLWASATLGCHARTEDGTTVATEANDLGVTHIELRHDLQNGDRLLTIRALDESDQEIALATLRTGMVLYTFEPDLIPESWNRGTELTASAAQDHFVSITPDREPHETRLPDQHDLATFVRLQAVAAAIKDEAGIWFSQPQNTGEVTFSAATCTASHFPASPGTPTECCEDGTTEWHKINGGANSGKLAQRTYGSACTMSNGGTVCGNQGSPQGQCTYGPCGAMTNTITGSNTTDAVVFVPNSQPTVCGRDSNGSASGGGMEAPEAYDGSQTLYGGITSACSYVNCCYNPSTQISEPTVGDCGLPSGTVIYTYGCDCIDNSQPCGCGDWWSTQTGFSDDMNSQCASHSSHQVNNDTYCESYYAGGCFWAGTGEVEQVCD